MGKSGVKTSLRHKLLVAFLLIALVPLGILLYFNYANFNYSLQRSIDNNLIALTGSKVSLLEGYLKNMEADVSLLAKMPIVVDSLEADTFTDLGLGQFLNNYYKNSVFYEIVLVTNSGKTINHRLEPIDIILQEPGVINAHDQARTLLELAISKFIELEDGSFAFYIGVPVFREERPLGTVVVKGSTNNLAQVINDYTGLGNSGEVIIVASVDQRIVSIIPTRLQTTPQRVYDIPKDVIRNDPNLLPLVQAIGGTRGFGSMTDYRRVPVLAAWRYLPTLHGGMIVKIDRSEVLQPVLEQQQNALLGAMITTLIVSLVAVSISNSITSSLIELTQMARMISSGDLEQRLKVNSQDEIGELAHSFNVMSDRLADAFMGLENKVEERTKALSDAYSQIESLNIRLAKENRRLSTELDVVKQLQDMILPKEEELRQILNLDMSAYMCPADEVGGDYYDVLTLDDRCLITIGDVTGHGLESGVYMLMAQTAVRTLYLSKETSYVNFLSLLNQTLYENGQRMNIDRSMTLIVLEYEQGVLRLSGQHEEVIIVRHDGKIERIDTINLGFPLGLEQDISSFIEQKSIYLDPGDVVVLYTDGITEAENDHREFYGPDRLCGLVQSHFRCSAREIRDAIIKDVLSFVEEHHIFDDMTLFVFKQL